MWDLGIYSLFGFQWPDFPTIIWSSKYCISEHGNTTNLSLFLRKMRKRTENLSPEETLYELILCPWFPSIKFHIICCLYQCSLPNTCPWLIKSYPASLLKMTHWVILPRNIYSSPRKACGHNGSATTTLATGSQTPCLAGTWALQYRFLLPGTEEAGSSWGYSQKHWSHPYDISGLLISF